MNERMGEIERESKNVFEKRTIFINAFEVYKEKVSHLCQIRQNIGKLDPIVSEQAEQK